MNAEPNSFTLKMVSVNAGELSEQIHCTMQCRNTEDCELNNTALKSFSFTY